MGLGKCLPQNQPKPKRYLSVEKRFFFSKISLSPPESKIVLAVRGPIGHPGAVGVPKKAVFMTPNWLFTGKSVILIFQHSFRGFPGLWNILNVAKSLKQSTHFYSCHRYYQCETWVSFYHWWFEFRGYCTSFGGNSQRYKLEILWSLSKTLNRRISNDRRYTDHR